MNIATRTQPEWLMEDLEQIQRYFPGAVLLETLDTPFELQTIEKTRAQRGHERKASERVWAASERSDTGTQREASLPSKMNALLGTVL